MIETLAWCSPAELAELMHPRTGLATVSKFLPTVAEMHEFLRAKREAAEKFVPHTTWKRLEPIPDPADFETDAERRRRFVTEKLGYNPVRTAKLEPRVLSGEDMPKSLDLKTPIKPVSDELKQLLINDGYGHLVADGARSAA